MKTNLLLVFAVVGLYSCSKNVPDTSAPLVSKPHARTDDRIKGKHFYFDASANDYYCDGKGGCLNPVVIEGSAKTAAYANFENAVAQNTVQDFFSSPSNYDPLFGSGYFNENQVVLDHLTADADVHLMKHTGADGSVYYVALPSNCSGSESGQPLCDSAVFNFVFDPQ